ncbi:MAG: hypothetical protein Ta2A_05910 [Treponemataceae bacterium]|nr:MAG: hypothetical protein Ta2A_05910 [Treponemataceae bacterium]
MSNRSYFAFCSLARSGTGTLKQQFDRSPDEEVWGFMMTLKNVKAIKFIIFLQLRTLDMFAEYSAEELYDSYSDIITKAAVSEIEEKLAEFGKPMKPSKKEDCDDCTS